MNGEQGRTERRGGRNPLPKRGDKKGQWSDLGKIRRCEFEEGENKGTRDMQRKEKKSPCRVRTREVQALLSTGSSIKGGEIQMKKK